MKLKRGPHDGLPSGNMARISSCQQITISNGVNQDTHDSKEQEDDGKSGNGLTSPPSIEGPWDKNTLAPESST
jgi:hypothetical protein